MKQVSKICLAVWLALFMTFAPTLEIVTEENSKYGAQLSLGDSVLVSEALAGGGGGGGGGGGSSSGGIGGMISSIGSAIGSAVSAIGSAIGSAISAIGNAIGSVASAIGNALGFSSNTNDGNLDRAELAQVNTAIASHVTAANNMDPVAFAGYVAGLTTDVDRVAAEVARGRATGRATSIDATGVTVEKCSNGRGGNWGVEPPSTPTTGGCSGGCGDPSNDPARCRYLLANGTAGTLDLRGTGHPANVPLNLTWQVTGDAGGMNRSLSGVGAVTGSSHSTTITGSTNFVLTAQNSHGPSDTCSVNVLLDPPTPVAGFGCTDPAASNYDATVGLVDDGSCEYVGCMDNTTPADNYNPSATISDPASCTYSSTPTPAILTAVSALADIPGAIYSTSDRQVPVGVPIFLRWSGTISTGGYATQCIGIAPDDFTANPTDPSKHHAAVGDTDPLGLDTGVPTHPWHTTGLADGEVGTFTVQCTGPAGQVSTDSITLTGASVFSLVTLIPPTLTVNGSSDTEIFVRTGDQVTIQWDPNDPANVGCSLTPDVGPLTVPPSTPNYDAAGSASVLAVGQTNYTYACPGGVSIIAVTTIPDTQEI